MLFAICIVLIVLLIYISSTDTSIQHCVNNICYRVLDRPDAKDASCLLHKLNEFNAQLIAVLQRVQSAPGCGQYYQKIAHNIITNYDPNAIFEHRPTSKTLTSYVKDKGDEIAFCLRDAITDDLHDFDVIVFVNLHELSHIAMDSLAPDHPAEFWKVFKHLLIIAEQSKLYTPINYRNSPTVCCGIDITYNPYFDETIQVEGQCEIPDAQSEE